jgi:hypothetical protein
VNIDKASKGLVQEILKLYQPVAKTANPDIVDISKQTAPSDESKGGCCS